jgi:hypothetical protein
MREREKEREAGRTDEEGPREKVLFCLTRRPWRAQREPSNREFSDEDPGNGSDAPGKHHNSFHLAVTLNTQFNN